MGNLLPGGIDRLTFSPRGLVAVAAPPFPSEGADTGASLSGEIPHAR